MIEDPLIYDGVSYIYCYDCKKLYDRWTGNDISKDNKEIIDSILLT